MANNSITKTIQYLKDYGVAATTSKIIEKIEDSRALRESMFILDDNVRAEQKSRVFEKMPTISILVPLYNTPLQFLAEMIDSVCNQTYGNWELCLADGSDEEHANVEEMVHSYIEKDSRVKYMRLEENRGISENTNVCLSMATGDYIALFDHDDLLTEDALYEVVCRINEGADVIYTDEDKVIQTAKNKRHFMQPHYKPDYNPDLLRSCNYICHFFVVHKELALRVGGEHSEYDGSQDYDFILRCTELSKHIAHVPKLLYHWRIHAASTAADPRAKMYCYESGVKAVADHLKRVGVENATVEMREHFGLYKVKYALNESGRVTVVSTKKTELESELIAEELVANHYFEITPEQIKGDYILFTDSKIRAVSEDWLEGLLSFCQRPEIGMVCPKILKKNHTVFSCGISIDETGEAKERFVRIPDEYPGRYGRAFCHMDIEAVDEHCFLIEKELFFSQHAETVLDLCEKVRAAGKLIAYNSDAKVMLTK